MGGYNSGGHNRKKDYTSRYKQLDSFVYKEFPSLMKQKAKECIETSISWKSGGSIGIVICQDKLVVGYAAGIEADREEIHDNIYFNGVANNYGGADRLYFDCPCCGRRSRILYMHQRHFKCRKCARLNY